MLKRALLGPRNVLLLLIALGLWLTLPQPVNGQLAKLRLIPPVPGLPANAQRFPPPQTQPILNNGSLYTAVNPNVGQPGQLPNSFIASLSQDARLVHNGNAVDPFRLVTETQGFDFTASAPGGTLSVNGPSTGTFAYTIAGARARRSQQPTTPLNALQMPPYGYYNPYATLPYYRAVASYFNPASVYAPGSYFYPGTVSPIATPMPSTSGSYGSFGGDNNPFAAADKPKDDPLKDNKDDQRVEK